MDDLSSTINEILSNEENVKQLQSLASAMGLSSGDNNTQNSKPVQENNNSNQIAQLISALSSNSQQNSNHTDNSSSDFNMPDISQIMKLQKLFSSFSKEDDNILLLKALKPHLKDKNKKKIDDAIKIMQLISILPMIKEMGLFGGDLF